jgi:hypothetical protein
VNQVRGTRRNHVSYNTARMQRVIRRDICHECSVFYECCTKTVVLDWCHLATGSQSDYGLVFLASIATAVLAQRSGKRNDTLSINPSYQVTASGPVFYSSYTKRCHRWLGFRHVSPSGPESDFGSQLVERFLRRIASLKGQGRWSMLNIKKSRKPCH